MARCPIAPATELVPFLRIDEVPVFCNVLWPTRAAAESAARGTIELGFCPQTGLIYNVAFDPELVTYAPGYEASLHFSPRFQRYATGLVDRLVTRLDLRGKDILEIGCGKGEFLRMLCDAGSNRGLGFDGTNRRGAPGHALRIVTEPFGADATHLQSDLIVGRHVLEHVAEPLAFLRLVRRAAANRAGTHVYFEVPNALWTLADLGIWDILYEHVCYFAAPSLTRLFQMAGFKVAEVWTDFGDQFLCLDASVADEPGEPAGPDAEVARIGTLAGAFEGQFRAKRDHWNDEIRRLLDRGRRIALWGAGSKGVTFLNTIDRGRDIHCVVDLSPRKQGKFVPGSGQEVVAPETLPRLSPDVVLVMNPIYAEEIAVQCADLGVRSELRTV